MSFGTDPVERSAISTVAGGAEFLSIPERTERCRELAQQGYLVARVPQPDDGPSTDIAPAEDDHGLPTAADDGLGGSTLGLRQRMRAAIELALAQRGALPSRLGEPVDDHAWALDQLARSRSVDAPGLCVMMPSVRPCVLGEMLGEEDSAVLRAWNTVARTERVVLLFEDSDAEVSMLSPQPLGAALASSATPLGGSSRAEMGIFDAARTELTSEGRASHASADDVAGGAFVAPDSGLVGEGACDRAAGRTVAATALAQAVRHPAHEAAADGSEPPLGGAHGAEAGRRFDGSVLADEGDDWGMDAEAMLAIAPDADHDHAAAESPDPLKRQHAATLGLLFEALLEDPTDEPSDWVLEPSPDSDMPTLRADALEDDPASERAGRPTLHSADGLEALVDSRDLEQQPLPEGSVFDSPSNPPPAMADVWMPSTAARTSAAHGNDDPYAERSARSGASLDARDHVPSVGRRRPPTRRDTSRLARAVRLDHDACTRYARELDAAQGSQPVRVIEQLFRTRYTPLLETLSCGLEHDPARMALQGWSRTFSKSYAEGFTAIKLTGKRPPMVFDAPDLAVRIARMHGAKGAELLLVDGLRFDLAQRAWRLVGARVGARAVCVEELLLWSALPTVTPVQLKLLARGPGALKDLDGTSDADPLIHRDRSAATLRRMRFGSRDLLKLDVVEARLRETGGRFDERMADLADAVADAAVELIATMPAGTMLFVFGDHGFRMPAGGADERAQGSDSTPPASQGGPSPEEVLVPAAAWLVGHGPGSSN